jgi:hypothetical protein
LLTLVAENGLECWKVITEKLGFKNRREAIIEFLRINLDFSNTSDTLMKDFLMNYSINSNYEDIMDL